MNISMWKFVKRTLQVIAGLIILGIIAIAGYANSERLSYDVVYLSCVITDANGLITESDALRPSVIKHHGPITHVRLRKDWIRGKVLFNWIGERGVRDQENGLENTVSMNISPQKYSASDWLDKVKRTIDRETLVYRAEYKDAYWIERKCKKTTKSEFEAIREIITTQIKAKQKI